MSDRDFLVQKIELLKDWIESYERLMASVGDELQRLEASRDELKQHRDRLMNELATEEAVLYGTGE